MDDDMATLNRHYYSGIHKDWNLIATTKRNPREEQSDPMQPYSIKLVACAPHNHAVVVLWDDLAKDIVSLNQKGAFHVFGCYQIRNSGNTDTTPVVGLLHVEANAFSTKEGEDLARGIHTKYQNLLSKSKALSSKPAIETDFTVEIVEIVPCASNLGRYFDGLPFKQDSQPGSSIGFKSSDSSGSIGAFFKITLKDGETKNVLLTNHHVVKPGNKKDKERVKACLWDKAAWSNNPPSNLYSPSLQDLKFMQKGYLGVIEMAENRIKNREKQLCDPIQLPDATRDEEYRKQIKVEHEKIRGLQNCITSLDPQNSKWALGCRLVTSGWRSDTEGYQMDWALATLARSTTYSNSLPRFSNAMKFEVQQHIEQIPRILERISSSTLKPNEYVTKVGRTSNWTIGIVNTCASYHFEWHAKGQMSKAYSIVGHDSNLFNDQGDSGSVLINTNGEVAALLFAADRHGPAAYAIDITRVINDIKNNTEIAAMELFTEEFVCCS